MQAISNSLIHSASKRKQDTKLLPMTSPNIHRFSKFFRWLADSAVNLQQTRILISHHTLNMSLHYAVKYECQKTGDNLKYVFVIYDK